MKEIDTIFYSYLMLSSQNNFLLILLYTAVAVICDSGSILLMSGEKLTPYTKLAPYGTDGRLFATNVSA